MTDTHIAIFPGSFDPPTLGHLNIIDRSLRLYDRLYVVVADNINKKSLLSAQERVEVLKKIFRDRENIIVDTYDGLIVNYAKKHNIGVMIRGVRAVGDFGYEFELAMTNKQLMSDLEVLFMPTDPNYFMLRSSQIKEMAAFGADISSLVPKEVVELLKEKGYYKNN